MIINQKMHKKTFEKIFITYLFEDMPNINININQSNSFLCILLVILILQIGQFETIFEHSEQV